MTPFALAHIVAGTIAVSTGVAALLSRKGGRLHRGAGRIFVVSMSLTAAGGAFDAFDRPEMLTAILGFFTCYLVLSSLHTVRPRGRHAQVFDGATLLAALLLAAAFFGAGAIAPPMEPGLGITPAVYYAFGAIALAAAAGDLASGLQGGLGGRWRIARHLWRMGLALYIAAGSLFDGPGTSVFPEPLQGTRWLAAPVDAIAFVVLAWFGIVLLGHRWALSRNGLSSNRSRKHGSAPASQPATTTNTLGDAR